MLLIILIVLILLVFALLIYMCSMRYRHLLGAHASIVEPISIKRYDKETKLYNLVGKINNDTLYVSDFHHFPIIYGSNTMALVHGIPINYLQENTFHNKEQGVYSVIELKEERYIASMLIYKYFPGKTNITKKFQTDDDDKKLNGPFERIRFVLLPEATEEFSTDQIDFAYLPKLENENIMHTMYKYNTLPKGEIKFNETIEFIEKCLNKKIDKIRFQNKLYIQDNVKYAFCIERVNNSWKPIYKLSSMSNKTNKPIVANIDESTLNKMFNDFCVKLLNENYIPYLSKRNDKYINLRYVDNDIINGYDVMKLYANVPLESLSEDELRDVSCTIL